MISEIEFNTIITTKSEISAIEYDCTQSLEKLRELDLKTRYVVHILYID